MGIGVWGSRVLVSWVFRNSIVRVVVSMFGHGGGFLGAGEVSGVQDVVAGHGAPLYVLDGGPVLAACVSDCVASAVSDDHVRDRDNDEQPVLAGCDGVEPGR